MDTDEADRTGGIPNNAIAVPLRGLMDHFPILFVNVPAALVRGWVHALNQQARGWPGVQVRLGKDGVPIRVHS